MALAQRLNRLHHNHTTTILPVSRLSRRVLIWLLAEMIPPRRRQQQIMDLDNSEPVKQQ